MDVPRSQDDEMLVWNPKLQIRGGIHIIFFLFLDEYIYCGYSLEVPRRGTSNEYPQHMFLLRNKKDISIFRMKKAPYLLQCECHHLLEHPQDLQSIRSCYCSDNFLR